MLATVPDVMSDPNTSSTDPQPNSSMAAAQVIVPSEVMSVGTTPPKPEPTETVSEPGKVMRIGSMIKQLLEEVRQAPLDDSSRLRLTEIYETSIKELSSALSPDLREELNSLASPFGTTVPSDSELRIAQAQLVGWLEGLFHGIQATLMAQQMAAQAQLQQMRNQMAGQQGLPPGMVQPGMGQPGAPEAAMARPDERPGTYL
jgi:Protein of unknown function (DUF2587)